VWFTHDEAVTDGGRTLRQLMEEHGPALVGSDWCRSEFPILVKFIFTSERLSIQVHPDDERARSWEESPGKTEMWRLLRTGPGATLGVGFHEPLARERLRAAALSGEIEELVRWFPVKPGETFFIAPGTVHAIGAGVALCEIQQNSDVTYRLYDYGRPRELHLDKGVAVSEAAPHSGPVEPMELGGGKRLLASCPHFRTEEWELSGAAQYRPDPERVHILIFLEGRGTLDGRAFSAGEVWIAPACAPAFELAAEGNARMLRTYVPPTASANGGLKSAAAR
jgi:mannose-6-phosphate isomerase